MWNYTLGVVSPKIGAEVESLPMHSPRSRPHTVLWRSCGRDHLAGGVTSTLIAFAPSFHPHPPESPTAADCVFPPPPHPGHRSHLAQPTTLPTTSTWDDLRAAAVSYVSHHGGLCDGLGRRPGGVGRSGHGRHAGAVSGCPRARGGGPLWVSGAADGGGAVQAPAVY